MLAEDKLCFAEVRLWDRLFDLYVMTAMQATADLLRPEDDRDERSVAQACARFAP